MGVHNLWKLLAPFAEPTSPEDWRGKSVAIDASVWIEQFRATAGKTASPAEVQEKITEGFLRRMLKLLFYGIKPVVVFDGPTPALKRRELMRRRQVREENADAALRAKARQLLIRSLTSGTIIKQASEDVNTGHDAESDHDGEPRGEVAGAAPVLDGEVAVPSQVPVTVSAAEARDLVRRASEMLSHELTTNAAATSSFSSSTLIHRRTSSNRAHRGNASDARDNEDDDDDDGDQTPPRALQPRGYAAKMAAFASPHDRHRRDQADSHDDENDDDVDEARLRVGLFGHAISASSPNGSSSAHPPPPAATAGLPQQQSSSTARFQGALSSGSFFDFFSQTDLPNPSSGAVAEGRIALRGGASIADDLRSSSNLQGRLSGELSAPSSSALQGSLAMAYEDERQKRAREDDALLSASRRGRRSENIAASVHQHHSTSTSGTLPDQLSSTHEGQQQHDDSVADQESSEHLNRLAAMASHQSSGVEAALSSTASAQLGRFTRQMERFTASREALEQRAKANMVRSGHVYLGPRSALGLDGGVALPAAPHAPQRHPAAPQPQPPAATTTAEGAHVKTSVQHGAQHVITSTTDETFGRVEDHVFAALEAAELVDGALASDRQQDPAPVASLPQAPPHASPGSLASSATRGERVKGSSAATASTATTLPTFKSGRVTVAELARLFEESVVAAAAARETSRSTDLSSDGFLDVDEESEDDHDDDDDSTTSTDSSSEVMSSSPDSSQEGIQEDGTSATLPDEVPAHVKEERIDHDNLAKNHKEDDDEGVFNGETEDFDEGNDEINEAADEEEEEEEEEKEESHVANDEPEASNATVVFLDVESSPSQSPSRHHRSAEEIAMELESSDDVFPVSSSALFLGGVRPLSVRLSTEAKVSEFAEQVRRENTAALASQKSPTTPIEQFVGSSLFSQEKQRQQRLTQKSNTEEVTIEDEWCNALVATTAATTPANAGPSTSARAKQHATPAVASAGRAHRAVMHSRQVVECISDDDDDDEVVMIEESGSVLCVGSARLAHRGPSSHIARPALASATASAAVVAREDTLLVIDSDSDSDNDNVASAVTAIKSDAIAEAASTLTRDQDPPVAVKSEPAPPTLVPVAVKNEPAETTSVDQRQTPSSLGSSAAVQPVRKVQAKQRSLYTGRAESAVLPVAQSPPIPTEAAGLVQLLNAFNVPWVVAASEADAQCGHLCETGLVSCVLTEDSDAFLFGASAVVRDFFSSQAANATLYRSNEIADAGLSRDVLIALAQLLGSDYAPGLPSVGAVVAVEIAAAFRATSSAPLAANNVGQPPHDELNNNSRNDKRSFAIDAVRLLSRCKRHTLHRARSISSLSETPTDTALTHQGQAQMEQLPREPGDVRSIGDGEGSDDDSDDEDRTALDVVKQRIVTDRLHSRGYDQPSAWPAAFPSTTIVEGYVAPTVTDVSWMRDVLIAFGERPRCDICVNPRANSGNDDGTLADQKALRVAGPDWGQVRDIAAVSCGWNSAAIAARVDAVVAEWALRTGGAPPPATTQTASVVFGAGAQPGLGSGAAVASSTGAGAKHASAGASKLSVGQTTLDSFRDKLFVGKQDDENKNRSDPDDPHFRADDRDGFDAWVARRMTALPPRRVPSAHIASANAAAAAAKSEARREKARQKKKAETQAMKDADARASFSFETLLPQKKKSGKRERDEDSDDVDDADVVDRSADLGAGRESVTTDGQVDTADAAASPPAPLAVAAPQRQTSSGTWCGIGLFTAGAHPRTVPDVPEATVTDTRHRAPVGLDDGSAVAAVQEPDSD